MAEIEIERRPRRSGWTWFALLLVLAGVAIGAWLVFGNGIDSSADARPAAETTTVEPLTEPVGPLEGPDTRPDGSGIGEEGSTAGQPVAPVDEPETRPDDGS